MPRTRKDPTVSEKNTKTDILSAYHALLSEINAGSDEPFHTPEEDAVIDTATKETVEKLTSDLSNLKLTLNKTIADLTERLTGEAERFATIQRAIDIAQKDVLHIQKIKITAVTLQRMIELQKEKEALFEKEMAEKQRTWDEEQRIYEESAKRGRTRGEEEYRYEQELLKKRDADERTEEKLERERQNAQEKEAKMQMIKELEDLRKKTVGFPVETEKAVKEAVGKALTETRKDFETEKQFTASQHESGMTVAKLKIDTLEQTVKSQLAEITRLRTQFEEATRQVKDIAVAVIEGKKEPAPQKTAN
ncbi:MAG: hypothetical protein UV63_C0033G0019 [Microgenomates group bacterium GW2011_GWC1_43_11]|nr:MAG: hypothetical protein UV63_C0033G0019 [Microgenomates group bacterium GW2011_GWC1_43_11]